MSTLKRLVAASAERGAGLDSSPGAGAEAARKKAAPRSRADARKRLLFTIAMAYDNIIAREQG
jgi:hypothetical protein